MGIPTGSELRAARKSEGLTQGEVASRANVSQALISRVESDDVDPRLSTVHRIAAVINDRDPVNDDQLLDRTVQNAIRDQRQAEGLTQADLAQDANVSQPLIARIENNDVDTRISTARSILASFENPPVISSRSARDDSLDKSSSETPSDPDILNRIAESFGDI